MKPEKLDEIYQNARLAFSEKCEPEAWGIARLEKTMHEAHLEGLKAVRRAVFKDFQEVVQPLLTELSVLKKEKNRD